MAVEILFHDRHMILVSKPPGLDVHGRGPDDKTSLVARVAKILGLPPRQLHPAARLDRPVSGVVPLARSKVARRSLTQQYQRRAVSRLYVALAQGAPAPPAGRWDRAIGQDRSDRRHRTIDGADARAAVTDYQLVTAVGDQCSLVELRPRTGRTHQLRVHLAQLGRCPILGDRRYGGPTTVTFDDGRVVAVGRVMLHAARIALAHPESGAPLEVSAPLWADMADLVESLSEPGAGGARSSRSGRGPASGRR